MSFQTNTLHLVSLTIVCSTWAQLSWGVWSRSLLRSTQSVFVASFAIICKRGVRASQVKRVGHWILFCLFTMIIRVWGLLTQLITNLIIIPSPMFMVMTWLVWIMTWLVHYVPTQLERTNKVDMLGVTIVQTVSI